MGAMTARGKMVTEAMKHSPCGDNRIIIHLLGQATPKPSAVGVAVINSVASSAKERRWVERRKKGARDHEHVRGVQKRAPDFLQQNGIHIGYQKLLANVISGAIVILAFPV
jgi:hypothetical protein